MKRRTWLISLAAGTAALVLAFLMLLEAPVSLEDLSGAKSNIEVEGFNCTTDRADGTIGNGFLVSRKPTNWHEANLLAKVGPMGAEWKGRVWICRPCEQPKDIMPSDAAARNWGGVYAFGDGEFLNEIEIALKWSRFRSS